MQKFGFIASFETAHSIPCKSCLDPVLELESNHLSGTRQRVEIYFETKRDCEIPAETNRCLDSVAKSTLWRKLTRFLEYPELEVEQ